MVSPSGNDLDPDIASLLGIEKPAPSPAPTASPTPSPSSTTSAPPSSSGSFDDEFGIGGLDDFDDEPAAPAAPKPQPVSSPTPAAPTAEQISSAPPAGEPAEAKKPAIDPDAYRLPGITSKYPYKEVITFETDGFIKRAVHGEDIETLKRVAGLKKKFDNPPDKKDKFLYRQKLTAAYWNMLSGVAEKIGTKLSVEKKLLLRYGLLDPKYLAPEQLSLVRMIPLKKEDEVPILYMDEWLRKVAEGTIKQSLVDETKKRRTPAAAEQEKLERKLGSRDSELSNLSNKLEQMQMTEEALMESVRTLADREVHPVYENIKYGYSKHQLSMLNEILHSCRRLSLVNKEVQSQFRVLDKLESEIEHLRGLCSDEEEEEAVIEVDTGAVKDEFNSLKQMIKMCVGRQGNHFPILYSPYFAKDIRQVCTRENIMEEIKLIERLDPGLFKRRYKGEEHRIMPYIIVLPGYGEKGICWEPYDKYNKASSRGRVAICMFAKFIRFALLTALADLRWQVAKETAQHYWMEEGLTGKYYSYYTDQKLRGDIKMHFINDYITWITMESQGMQKLHRDARPVFWRYTPFPQDLKDILRNRGFFYSDLYKKDQNIARSDGY